MVQNFLIQEIPTAGAPPDRARLLQQQIEHPRDGHLEIPTDPGWGVDLDEEFIRSVLWDPSTPRKPPWLPLRPDGGLVHT